MAHKILIAVKDRSGNEQSIGVFIRNYPDTRDTIDTMQIPIDLRAWVSQDVHNLGYERIFCIRGNEQKSGTVSVSADSKAVVGTDTAFETELRENDPIVIGGQVNIVDEITDDTHLTLKNNQVEAATDEDIYYENRNIISGYHQAVTPEQIPQLDQAMIEGFVKTYLEAWVGAGNVEQL